MNAQTHSGHTGLYNNRAYVAAWLIASTIAITLALLVTSASFVDGEYVPVSNDSFYHARRILDAAIGERGFYQFDNMIHVPEGSWINWPWGYDYLMASALSVALKLRPTMEPMAFLAHVPVAWLFVNIGLLTLLARRIALSPSLTAVALLGFAMMPITQTTHGVGSIDHHYFEMTFVLATIVAGLGFFSLTKGRRAALSLGIVLGIAPAFHNGLFILQVPVLLCLFVLWLRGQMPSMQKSTWFSAALFASTLLILLPSEPFRDMQFEFWTLSWFHLYVAACSAIGTLFIALRPFSIKNTVVLAALVIVLVIPLFAKIVMGAAFLGGDLVLLDQITEARSPILRLWDIGGYMWIAVFYSWLVYLSPILIVVFAIRAWRDKDPAGIFFAIFVVCGLALLLTQIRFNPYGSWALMVATSLVIQDISKRYGVSMLATTAVTLLAVAIAFQPPLQNRLLKNYPPGMDDEYGATRYLFKSLAASCAEDPGVVIAYSDDGNYIRYHTDCSIIANNFIMTPQHEEKLLELDAKMRFDPQQFLDEVDGIKYVYTRMHGSFEYDRNGILQAAPINRVVDRNTSLFIGLTFGDELPKEYQLIDEVQVGGGRDFAYARIFKIVREPAADSGTE